MPNDHKATTERAQPYGGRCRPHEREKCIHLTRCPGYDNQPMRPVDEILAALPLDSTAHVTDCGYDDPGGCGCFSLPHRLQQIIEAAKAEAWDEGVTKASPHGGAYLRSLLIENPYRDVVSPPGESPLTPARATLVTDQEWQASHAAEEGSDA